MFDGELLSRKGSITDIASASALTKMSETSAGTASFAEGSAQGMAQVQYKSDINADPSSMNTIRRTERNSQANISGWIVRNGKKQTVSHNAETADRDRVKNKETSNYTRKYAARLARSSFPFGNLFAVKIIGVEERKSQESLQWGRKRNVIRKQAHTGLE